MRSGLGAKFRQYSRIIAAGRVRPIVEELTRWTWFRDDYVGMERDLTVPHEAPPARVPIEVVKLDEPLAKRLFSEDGVDPVSALDLARRRRIWEDGLPGAYVAIDDNDVPCYVQWAIPGEHADFVETYFGGRFPELGPDDLLLEGAWARPEARGKRIMAEAMDRITLDAAVSRHRRAITFVGVDNEPSLRGCRAAGYEVYIERQERWRFGSRRVTWSSP